MALFKRDRSPDRSGRKAFNALPMRSRAITFYAEDGDSWPHFESMVRELTGTHGRDVCYLTSSDDDPILADRDPLLHAFPIGDGAGRSFFFKSMQAGIVVATVPRLGVSQLPRSQYAPSLGMEYVHVFHSMASTHMIYDADGFDRYDTVLCVGPYMVEEIRRREEVHGLPAKELVLHGYGRLDSILEAQAAAEPGRRDDRTVVLIAPSWGPTCIFETCGAELVGHLLDAGYEVIARPHPMTRKHSPRGIADLEQRFGGLDRFTLDLDIAGQASLHRSDVMVSDWSGAALEYAFGLERPVLFVDVPRKVNNADWAELGIEPFEASIRADIGRIVDAGDLARAPAVIAELMGDRAGFVDAIRSARTTNIAHVGTSGGVAAELIAAKADAFLARLDDR